MADYSAMKDAVPNFPSPNLSDIKGLTTAEAKKRQEIFGKNEIPEVKELLWYNRRLPQKDNRNICSGWFQNFFET